MGSFGRCVSPYLLGLGRSDEDPYESGHRRAAPAMRSLMQAWRWRRATGCCCCSVLKQQQCNGCLSLSVRWFSCGLAVGSRLEPLGLENSSKTLKNMPLCVPPPPASLSENAEPMPPPNSMPARRREVLHPLFAASVAALVLAKSCSGLRISSSSCALSRGTCFHSRELVYHNKGKPPLLLTLEIVGSTGLLWLFVSTWSPDGDHIAEPSRSFLWRSSARWGRLAPPGPKSRNIYLFACLVFPHGTAAHEDESGKA